MIFPLTLIKLSNFFTLFEEIINYLFNLILRLLTSFIWKRNLHHYFSIDIEIQVSHKNDRIIHVPLQSLSILKIVRKCIDYVNFRSLLNNLIGDNLAWKLTSDFFPLNQKLLNEFPFLSTKPKLFLNKVIETQIVSMEFADNLLRDSMWEWDYLPFCEPGPPPKNQILGFYTAKPT